MPHITLEHTKNLKKTIDIKKINTALHQCLSEQDTVSLNSIKTRSLEVDNVIVGDGTNNEFVHINVQLLSGRCSELKNKMADSLFNIAKKIISNDLILLSVNVTELGNYKK